MAEGARQLQRGHALAQVRHPLCVVWSELCSLAEQHISQCVPHWAAIGEGFGRHDLMLDGFICTLLHVKLNG